MAYTLKKHRIYTTPQGIELDEAYAAIDVVISDKRAKTATIILKIYCSKAIADDTSNKQIESIQIVLSDYGAVTDFTDYMGHAVVMADDSQYTQAYRYFNDNEISKDGFVYADWESDETN